MKERHTFEFLRDSTVITTGIAVLLFVWGSSFQAFTANLEGLPLAFLPEFTVQEHMMNGGLIAIFLLPLFAILIVADGCLRGRLKTFIRRANETTQDAFMLSAALFAISVGALYPLAWASVHFFPPDRLRVSHISLKSEADSGQFRNLYFVTRRGENFVFIGRPGSRDQFVSVLHADELRWMTLNSADQETSPTVIAPK